VFPSASTVEGDLEERRAPQRFWVVADTEVLSRALEVMAGGLCRGFTNEPPLEPMSSLVPSMYRPAKDSPWRAGRAEKVSEEGRRVVERPQPGLGGMLEKRRLN